MSTAADAASSPSTSSKAALKGCSETPPCDLPQFIGQLGPALRFALPKLAIAASARRIAVRLLISLHGKGYVGKDAVRFLAKWTARTKNSPNRAEDLLPLKAMLAWDVDDAANEIGFVDRVEADLDEDELRVYFCDGCTDACTKAFNYVTRANHNASLARQHARFLRRMRNAKIKHCPKCDTTQTYSDFDASFRYFDKHYPVCRKCCTGVIGDVM